MICYCCTAQGMHMHMWTMPCRGNDENRHAQLQSTRLTLTVLRASGQTASSHLTRIKITHYTCTGGNVPRGMPRSWARPPVSLSSPGRDENALSARWSISMCASKLQSITR